MSSPKYKLHFASAILQTLKEIKSLILPAFIVLAANGFRLNLTSFESFFELIPVLIIILIFLFTIVRGISKWLTFTYWIEEQELKTEYGLLFKNKRYIPIERIQSLNTNEGIIHRLFDLVHISIETAGGGGAAKKSEVELSAITKDAAVELEQYIQKHRKGPILEEQQEVERKRNIIYQIKNKELLLLATTSNGIMVVLASIGAVFSQTAEFIPYEKITSQFAFVVEFGIIVIVILVILGLLAAWFISVIMTYLSYYSFTLSLEDEQVEITRGLLNKKKLVIPIQKIQAIKVVENPLRQLFGYANVSIESAGGGMESSTETKVTLLPFVKKDAIPGIIQQLDADFMVEMEEADKSPMYARPLFYRKYLYIGVPAAILGGIFLSPYLWLLLVVTFGLVLLGFIQHKSARIEIKDQQIRIQYRVLSKVLYNVKRNKVQACEHTQTWFQKRLNVYTGKIFVMGNMGGVKIKVPHQAEESIWKLFDFIKKDV